MNNLLQSNWTVALVGSVLYSATLVLSWRPHLSSLTAPPPKPAEARALGPSWNFFNPEIETLIRELKNEKAQLDARRAQLDQWESRLKAERMEINTVTQIVHQMQLDLDQSLLRMRDDERDNLKRLAKVYSEMTPETVAKILQELDDDAMVKQLSCFKDSEVAAIVEIIARDPAQVKRAARVAERLRVLSHANPATSAKPKTP